MTLESSETLLKMVRDQDLRIIVWHLLESASRFSSPVDTLGSYLYVGRVLETVSLLQRCLRSKRNNTIVVLHVHVYLYLHVNFGLHERVVINRNLDFVPANLINNLHRINVRQISLFVSHTSSTCMNADHSVS